MFGQSAMRTSQNGFGIFRICAVFILMTMARADAEDSIGTNQIHGTSTIAGEEQMNMPVSEPPIHKKNIIDSVQGSASSRLGALAQWADSFFDDPQYAEEEASARASLQQTITFYRNLEPEYRSRVRASAVLPNLDRKLRLSFEGNDALNAEDPAEEVEESLAESAQESVDDSSLRLQYLFLQSPDFDLGFSGGVRLRETSFYLGPRIKLRSGIGSKWDAKFTQRIYWYTTNDLKTKMEVRFDRLFRKRNLFRQAFRTNWDEEKHSDEGFRNTVTSSITRPLSKKSAALRYAWSSIYLTRPDPRWTSTTLSVGYRRSIWRQWIILEASPFVTWEEEFGWDPKPGITIAVSTIIEKK